MASQIRRVIFNTRERALSTDYNDMTAMLHRSLIEAAAAIVGGQTGVVSGMAVNVVGVGLDVTVSPGLALRDSGAGTENDSAYEWIELLETQTVTLAAADAIRPRWDVIEIAANDAVLTTSLRDVFNPALGTFTPQSVTKVSGSEPTLTSRAGTASTPALLPAGVAGVIPLAYVYVPAAATNLTTTNVIMCRPLIGGGGNAAEVRGGGVQVAAAGLDVTVVEASGRFDGRSHSWRVPGGAAYTLAATNISGAAIPVANDDIHWYAAPAPYPAGYDAALAGREFVPGAGVISLFTTVVAGQTGCIVFASTDAPDPGTAQGNTTLSVGSITDPIWNGVTISADDVTYLGTARYVTAAGDLIPQRYNGAGEVVMSAGGFTAAVANEIDTQNSSSQATTPYDASRADPLSVSGDVVLPPHAGDVRLRLRHNWASTAGFLLRFFDNSSATVYESSETVAADAVHNAGPIWVGRTGTWEHAETIGADSTVAVTFDGYKDLILGRR